MKIGIIDKVKNKLVYTYFYHRYKTFTDYANKDFIQFEIDNGTHDGAYSWDGSNIVFDPKWELPQEDSGMVTEKLMRDAIEFSHDLIIDFGKENVLMGISQLNKTGPVLSIMTDKIDIGNGYPISIMDTIQGGSLHETIKVIDYHIANMDNYIELSPFITIDRFNNFKKKIISFLGE